MPNLSTLSVRGVTLLTSDDRQTHREKLARIVLDEMYQFVGLLDASGNTLEINQAALKGAGLQMEDIEGKPFWETRWWAVSKTTQELQRDLCQRAQRGEFVRRDIEIFGEAAGEETIVIDFSLLPVRDSNGDIVFLLAEGRNITEKKRAEAVIAQKNEELQALLDRVRRLDQLKSDFFANVSHELRTPLALILGPTASLLSQGGNLTDLQRRDLTVVHRNAATLLKHVNDLLDVSKLDAGQHAIEYQRVDLALEVRKMAAHFDALAPERAISYSVVTPATLTAEVDIEKFQRIVLNLLSNAFKFTPPGGRIRCGLELKDSAQVLLSVQDSGPGVAPDLREAIFERFRQAQMGTTRDFGGTGLGLSIASDFAQLHGGSISVSDAPGGGALFAVVVPRIAPAGAHIRSSSISTQAAEAAGPAAAVIEELQVRHVELAEQSPAPGDLPLVLVVEDNADMRRFIIENLREDYRILAAVDGVDALEKATSEAPDLVITDLMMPRMGGDLLVAELRSREPLAQVPVLVLSAKADEELRLKLLAESVQDFVVKPFSSHELRVRVRNLVVMKRMRDALQRELATKSYDVAEMTALLVESRRSLQRINQELAQSEQRWRAVFEYSAAGIAVTDAEGRFQSANQAFQKITGYTEKQLQSLTFLEITETDYRAANGALIAELLEGRRQYFEIEKTYRRANGETVWVHNHVSAVLNANNEVQWLVAIVEDITQRKRASEEMRKLALVVEHSMDFIGLASPEGEAQFLNRAGQSVIGLEPHQVRERSISDFISPREREHFAKDVLPIIFKEGRWEGETTFQHFLTGASIPMWQHIFFVTEQSTNKRLAIATISRDISESKRSAERLQLAQSQLAHMARVTTMGELAASIGHEVNQPLTAVVSNANAALRWLNGPKPNLDEARAAVSRIAKEGARAGEVVARIRSLMKRNPTQMMALQINEVIREVLLLTRHQTVKHGISVRTDLEPHLPAVFGDPVELQQVILNLILNGIDAIAKTEKETRDLELISQRTLDEGVLVAVRDSGTGFGPEVQSQLFNPFFTTKSSGMGMGLSISRSIVERHGGRLWAIAKEGQGAIFQFVLPPRGPS